MARRGPKLSTLIFGRRRSLRVQLFGPRKSLSTILFGRRPSLKTAVFGRRRPTKASSSGCSFLFILAAIFYGVIHTSDHPSTSTSTRAAATPPQKASPTVVPPSSATARSVASPVATATTMPVAPKTIATFATAAEAQREAVRRYPDLGIAGSKLNGDFVARHKAYQQQRPEYFRDTSWPLHLTEELIHTPQTK